MPAKNTRGQSREIETSHHFILVSYTTPVAIIEKATGKAYRTKRHWSVTTTRHINSWSRPTSFEKEQPEQEWFDNTLSYATHIN